MKKYYFLIIVTLILGLVLTGCTLLSNVGQVPTTGQSGVTYLTKHTEGDPFVTDLIADGGDSISATDVGEVLVWNDGETLYVQYVVTAPWCLTETHLHVFLDAVEYTDVPQKNGNPIPGKFDYKGKHDCLADYTYEIPLAWDLGTPLFIAAHAKVIRPIEDCWETVWQIGDVEGNDGTGKLTNYCDEFNYAGFYEGLGPLDPPFTDPFMVDTTPTNMFPWLSLGTYATDFKVQWFGELLFGGKLTVSWSPGQSAKETKIIMSMDDGVPFNFVEYGSYDPVGWRGYPLVQSVLELNQIGGGSHEIRFQHTTGDGAIWDWVRLEKPCEQEETAWAAGIGFPGKNWATYFTYKVQGWNLVDILTVDAADVGGEDSTDALESGKSYKFEVSGTWEDSSQLNHFNDAEYVTFDSWVTPMDGTPNWGPDQKDLQINEGFVNWGVYDSFHEYTLMFIGEGLKVNFRIYDGKANVNPPTTIEPAWYVDNEGELTVKIYKWN